MLLILLKIFSRCEEGISQTIKSYASLGSQLCVTSCTMTQVLHIRPDAQIWPECQKLSLVRISSAIECLGLVATVTIVKQLSLIC